MKAINHETAQRMIHARMDGALEAAASARLDAHLQDCAACRRYAAQAVEWNADLYHAFHGVRRPSPAALSAPAVQAIYDRVATSRAKMKKMHFLNLPETATFVLLLLLLAGGLLLTISNPNLHPALVPLSQDQPTTAPTATLLPSPTPQPTATALPPWTESTPATSSAEIAPVLEDLAQKNIEYWLRPGWVYSKTSDPGKPGTLQMYSNETWMRYSADPGACPEMLAIVKEKPDSESILQMPVSLADGSFGDLLTLRSGESQVQKTNQGCPPEANTTTAGILARRITRQPTVLAKGSAGENLESIRAWYEPMDGKSVLVVWATFDTPAGMTPKTVESYWFDLNNGQPVQQGMRMEQENGNLTGETLISTQYQFLTKLPPTDAARVTAALAELQALAASPVVLPTATPLPIDAVAELSRLAYTESQPLTDGQKILSVLAALSQKQLDFVSKPGWYLYGRVAPMQGNLVNRYNLLHMLDSGQCELLTYYIQPPDERIATQQILLSDGTTGQANISRAVIEETIPATSPCSPVMLDSLIYLNNEIQTFDDLISGKTNGTYKAWTETINGHKVFALFYDIRFLESRPNIMDPDTHQFEALDRTQQWKYFDLQTGAILNDYYHYTLVNGKTFGEAPGSTEKSPYELTYLATPPDNLLQAFNKAVEELHNLMAKKE